MLQGAGECASGRGMHVRRKAFNRPGFSREELRMPLPDRRTYFRVANLALILQLVGRKLRHDGDNTARCLHFESLTTLETGTPQGGRRNDNRWLVLEGNGHNNRVPSNWCAKTSGAGPCVRDMSLHRDIDRIRRLLVWSLPRRF